MFKYEQTVRAPGQRLIVRCQDSGQMMRVVQTSHQFENSLGVAFVQIARGFVGQEQSRFVDESASNGYALLLSPGKFAGTLMRATPQAHFPQPSVRRIQRLLKLLTADEQRHGHVFCGGKVRQQVMSLPYETHRAIAIFSQIFFREGPQRISSEVYFTTCWSV